MASITIPATPEKCVESLVDIGGLMTAKEWERAAKVAALVGPAPGSGPGRGNRKSGSFAYTLKSLAAVGVVGLRDPDTIARYRDAWYVEAGRSVPALGARVSLPKSDWPPNMTVGRSMDDDRREKLMEAGREIGMTTGSKVVDVASNPRALEAAIKADQATARAAARALVATVEGRQVYREVDDRRVTDGLAKHGIDPRMPVEPFEAELDAEAIRIHTRLTSTALYIRNLRQRAERDQWPRLLPRIEKGITEVLQALQGVDESEEVRS